MAITGNMLELAQLNRIQELPPTEPAQYQFDMRLQDIPGEDGFPLAFTPWQIVCGEKLLFAGETDDQGRVMLDGGQQEQLSEAINAAPRNVWLSYPGQRVGISLHIEQDGWEADSIAMAALDYSAAVGPAGLLQQERSKQDSRCEGDLYTHLQSKD